MLPTPGRARLPEAPKLGGASEGAQPGAHDPGLPDRP